MFLSTVKKTTSAAVVILILSVSLTGCKGILVSKKVPSLVVTPNIIDFKAKTIEISGSGFIPGSIVEIGIPGLPVSKKLPGVTGLWFGVTTAGESGAFTVSVNLPNTLFSLVKQKVITQKELCRTHNVVAQNDRDQKATMPLIIMSGK